MTRRTLTLTEDLHGYLLGASLREHPVLRQLREETGGMARAEMQISPEQGQLMALLVRLMGARRVLEVGTFTGYSALVMALALPRDGRIVACDVSQEWTSVARRYWKRAGVEDRIDLRLGPALETLARLEEEGGAGTFDFAFLDADKENLDAYYEAALRLLRPGGLVAVDNALWSGRVADPTVTDVGTEAIRALNAKIHADPRVLPTLLPVGDGLMLALILGGGPA